MQTIRGFLLIVPFFIKSISSLLQELTNTNQSLSFVDGSILETNTFNPKNGRDISLSSNGKMILCTSLMFNQLLKYKM
ncbi:MAG TPA: hypothetical protein VIU35_11470 [Chitinophagaceae bacterium]